MVESHRSNKKTRKVGVKNPPERRHACSPVCSTCSRAQVVILNKNCLCAGPCIRRCCDVFSTADSLHPAGGGGGQRGAVLVLLVPRLVPVACGHLSLPALLQLGLRVVPTLRPQLHAEQGAPSGQGHPAHPGQRHLHPCRRAKWRRSECYPVGCLENSV